VLAVADDIPGIALNEPVVTIVAWVAAAVAFRAVRRRAGTRPGHCDNHPAGRSARGAARHPIRLVSLTRPGRPRFGNWINPSTSRMMRLIAGTGAIPSQLNVWKRQYIYIYIKYIIN
jgi:hypothetical protein